MPYVCGMTFLHSALDRSEFCSEKLYDVEKTSIDKLGELLGAKHSLAGTVYMPI